MSEKSAAGGRKGGWLLKVRVRKGNRTHAQTSWLDRQLNDTYVARAEREGVLIQLMSADRVRRHGAA